jgi:ABC-type bacteriocin/lantibiotic exporter with double-glycine peptidase domain
MFRPIQYFSLSAIFRIFWRKVGLTWAILTLETALLALIPLMIGRAIDGLLNDQTKQLQELALLFFVLIAVAVLRRVYDTRAYGSIRVAVGAHLNRRHPDLPISARSARQDMARELVDFLEDQAPQVLTAVVEIVVAVILLYIFHFWLAVSAVVALIGINLTYIVFSRRFFRLNADLNQQKEQQVRLLGIRGGLSFVRHLRQMRRHEVRISDTEAIVYGLIYLGLGAFVICNLWLATTVIEPSTGDIFSIVTYSFTLLEASVVLPTALQAITRLSEITQRINRSDT